MKKYQIFLTSIGLAVILAASISLAFFLRGTPPSKIENPEVPVPQQTQGQVNFTSKPAASQENSEIASSEPRPTIYLVREYQGHIGVFENDNPVPIRELDTLVSTLPSSDRALLTKGIPAETEAQLRSLLEDYGS